MTAITIALWLFLAFWLTLAVGIACGIWLMWDGVPVAPDDAVPVTHDPARRFDYECAVSRN